MAGQPERIADLERQVAELRAEFASVDLALKHAYTAGRESITGPRPAAPVRRLEAEVAALRHGAGLRADLIEARAYARGRESVLGVGSSQPAKAPQAERWLHAVPQPAAEAAAEMGA